MAATEPVVLRNARPEDREAIHALTLAAYGAYAERMAPSAWEGLRSALLNALATEAPAERIVAECEGSLVGSVMLFPPAVETYGGFAEAAPWPELRLLAVDPASRSRGVGRALVAECARRARESGAAALGLHTSDSMREAIRLYGAMGFIRAPEHDFRPEGAELVMAFRLPLDG